MGPRRLFGCRRRFGPPSVTSRTFGMRNAFISCSCCPGRLGKRRCVPSSRTSLIRIHAGSGRRRLRGSRSRVLLGGSGATRGRRKRSKVGLRHPEPRPLCFLGFGLPSFPHSTSQHGPSTTASAGRVGGSDVPAAGRCSDRGGAGVRPRPMPRGSLGRAGKAGVRGQSHRSRRHDSCRETTKGSEPSSR